MPTGNNIIKHPKQGLGIIYGKLKAPSSTIAKLEPPGRQRDTSLHIIAENQLLLRSDFPIANSPSQLLLNQRDFRKIEKALSYIKSNASEKISPEKLSIEIDISVSKLQAGLKLATGLTLKGYQEQMRITIAKDLLRNSSKSLKIISKKVGFKTHSHFGEIFKTITGFTPSEYRNNYGS